MSSDEVNNTPLEAVPPVQLHYLESMDCLANIAKANSQYPLYMNAMFQVATVLLSEINEERVDEVIGAIAAQAQKFREQRAAIAQQHAEAALKNALAANQLNEGATRNVH